MFKKLISNLSFNPSLIGQVAFYAKRMHREQSLRRLGFVFVALALVLQMFAAISPPEPTLAASNNDIIRGGFSSREQAVNYCRSNTRSFGRILSYYKISCDDLARATTKNIRSTDHGGRLHSMGRVAQGPRMARNGNPTGEYSVMIGGIQYFMRYLKAWDSGPYSTYKVLQVRNADGQTIYILYSCANIVTIGKYTPPPPPKPKPPEPPKDVCPHLPGVQTREEECDICPNLPGIQTNPDECYPCPEAEDDDAITACLEFHKTASNQTQGIDDANGTLAQAGDVIIYTLSATNKGTQPVQDFIMEENISDILEYAGIVDLDGGDIDSDNNVVWPKENIAAGATLEKKITVRVKDPIPQTPASASDPGSYDLTMTNVFYGTTVQIKLPGSVVKTTEYVTQTLPETGPGATLTIGFVMTAIVAYFFARSRLLAKELDIVRTDFASTGGM